MPLPPLPEPEQRATRLAGTVTGAAATAFLCSTLLAFNAAQAASLAARPFSRRAFRRFNRWAADTWWGWLVQSTRLLYGTQLVVTGDEVPREENAIVIANHQQMTDTLLLLAFARSKGRLGDAKWFVKKAVKYVPGVGWGMCFLDCPFLERDWSKDQASVERTFSTIVSEKLPLWFVSFPEGTRLTEAKHAESRRWAAEHGLPPLRHLLVPRTKGFVATARGLRSHVAAIYDLTLGYERGVPSLWQFMKGEARRAHLHVRRLPVAELPQGDEALAQWLLDTFREKDERLEAFYARGAFA